MKNKDFRSQVRTGENRRVDGSVRVERCPVGSDCCSETGNHSANGQEECGVSRLTEAQGALLRRF